MKPRLLYVVTAARSIKLLDGQFAFMDRQGYDVHLIASPGVETAHLPACVTFHQLVMEREIALGKDIRALFQMMRLVRKIRPDIINYGTPKAALLASLASWFWRVPKRIYTLRGLRLETIKGKQQKLLLAIEKIISACSHLVLCISPSLLEKAEELGIAANEKLVCAGAGSSNGMNISKLQPSVDGIDLCSLKNQAVIGYVGRLTKDKGIDELVQAFLLLKKDFPSLHLLIAGRLDEQHGLQASTITALSTHPDIVNVGYQSELASVYRAMDIFIFPTHREGFGNVAMEAAYAGLPVIATNVTGAKDTIVPDRTGLLVEVENPQAIQTAVTTLLQQPERTKDMGTAGQRRVISDFQQETIWHAILEQYTLTGRRERLVRSMEK